MTKWMGRALFAAIILGVIYSFAVQVLPGLIERQFNIMHTEPPYTASAEAQALHERLFVADMHADSLLWSRNLLEKSDIGQVDIPRLVQGNVALQAFTIVTKSPRGQNIDRNSGDTDRITDLVIASGWPIRTWGSLFERARYQMEQLHDYEAASDGQLRVIKTRADLDDFMNSFEPGSGKVAGWLGIEGAHPLEGKLENIDRLFDAGLRVSGITHFFDNELGGSMHGLSQAGLTDFGKLAVERMQQLGIMIDLAHASSAVIDDVLAMTIKPVVVSHGGVKGTCDNNRNLSDAQIKGIAATGGLIAIGYWDLAVCGKNATAIAKAMKYTADLVGAGHVALGSDFDGSVKTPFDTSGLALITEALLAEGFKEQEIAQMAGLNVVRVLKTTLPE